MANDFSSRLKKAIDDAGISASELSRISGVGKSDISYYLSGKYQPKQDKCFMLAKALGVDPGYLMTGVEQQNEDAVSEHESKQIRIVSGMMAEMTDEEKDQIVEIVYLLSKKKRKENEQ